MIYKPDSDLDHQKIVSPAINIEHLEQEDGQDMEGGKFAYNKFS